MCGFVEVSVFVFAVALAIKVLQNFAPALRKVCTDLLLCGDETELKQEEVAKKEMNWPVWIQLMAAQWQHVRQKAEKKKLVRVQVFKQLFAHQCETQIMV